jgi:hypothetical protein
MSLVLTTPSFRSSADMEIYNTQRQHAHMQIWAFDSSASIYIKGATNILIAYLWLSCISLKQLTTYHKE